MNLNISYRHMDSSPAVNDKIKQKVQHLEKFLDSSCKVDWVCTLDNDIQRSEVNVKSGHDLFHAKAESRNLYKTLDIIIEKLENQMRKQ